MFYAGMHQDDSGNDQLVFAIIQDGQVRECGWTREAFEEFGAEFGHLLPDATQDLGKMLRVDSAYAEELLGNGGD
jgi:hypothetical protein